MIERNTLAIADVMDWAATLAPQSVHCIVTSPPYFGLRDYGTARWVGGDEACGHQGRDRSQRAFDGHGGDWGRGGYGSASRLAEPYRDICGKCGARRVDHQIGLEDSPDAYVARLVAVFRALRPALHDSGTCWVNLGDSYSGGGGYWPDAPSNQPDAARARKAPGAQIAGARIKGERNVANGRLRLRQDLTPEQEAYVLAELARARSTSAATQKGRE